MHDVRLLDTPLNLNAAYAAVQDPGCGGLAFFVGTIRNHNEGEAVTHLEFSSYASMATKEMNKICDRAAAKFDLAKTALYHRTGSLAIGDVAVIVAVASKHRGPAFAGCEFIIDELKKHVPIWKKEFRADGTHWLNSRP